MGTSLTAILLPAGQLPDEEIARRVAERGVQPLLLRIAPLPSVSLTQVELLDGHRGEPIADATLAAALAEHGRSVLLRVDGDGGKATLRAFSERVEEESFVGAPGPELSAHLQRRLGASFAAVLAADDGTRRADAAGSHTVARARGRWLAVPAGLSTRLDSFAFHDRGSGRDEALERFALFAFDARAVSAQFAGTPGHALAAEVRAAPRGSFGPLEHTRTEVLTALDALGPRSPVEGRSTDERILELCAIGQGVAFAGGEQMAYWDDRVLPLFSLSPEPPVIPPEELDILDGCDSILHALVELGPFSAPPDGEGTLLYSLADGEVAPLAPWVRPGAEYTGAVYTVAAARLVALVRTLDERALAAMVERFGRVWYRAVEEKRQFPSLAEFLRAKEAQGANDLARFFAAFAELRTLLELAAANHLQVAILFYPPEALPPSIAP